MLKCKDMREAKIFNVLQDTIEATNVLYCSDMRELMRKNLAVVIKNPRIKYCLFLSPEPRRFRSAGLAVWTLLKENRMSVSIEEWPFDANAN